MKRNPLRLFRILPAMKQLNQGIHSLIVSIVLTKVAAIKAWMCLGRQIIIPEWKMERKRRRWVIIHTHKKKTTLPETKHEANELKQNKFHISRRRQSWLAEWRRSRWTEEENCTHFHELLLFFSVKRKSSRRVWNSFRRPSDARPVGYYSASDAKHNFIKFLKWHGN